MKHSLRFFSQLFWHTFKLSAFTFGGGYVIVPLMRKQFVDRLGWIDEKEMLDFVAIAQSSPGAMAVNASVLIGYRLAGFPGAVTTILATVTPPLLLLSLISLGYEAFAKNAVIADVLHGMQAGVCAVILEVVWEMASKIVKNKNAADIAVMVAAFIAVFLLKINVVFVIAVSALLGLLRAFRRKGGRDALS